MCTSVSKMDWKAHEERWASPQSLKEWPDGEAAIRSVYLRSRELSFFSEQFFCTVLADLHLTVWWLLAPSGVRWGIVITALNVTCWMFFLPVDTGQKINQFLVTREKNLLQSKRFLWSVEEERHFAWCPVVLWTVLRGKPASSGRQSISLWT